jgi:NADP-dependent 3-hydroxy acid dehydrogenase YdfG
LANGDLVAATALGKDDLNDVAEKYKDQVLLIKLNVTDKSQIENAIEETVKHFGRIDVLVNNTVEIQSASHSVFESHPKEIAQLIIRAATKAGKK